MSDKDLLVVKRAHVVLCSPSISVLHPVYSVTPSSLPGRAARRDERLYEIKPIEGKGVGLFAKRFLPRGTRIISEAPLILLSSVHYRKHELVNAYDKLTDEQKANYMTLASSHGQPARAWDLSRHNPLRDQATVDRFTEQDKARTNADKSVLSVFQVNCIGVDHGAGVFLEASRINHSCLPNAFFAWNARLGKETIHAIRDIKNGEEITIAYCDPYGDKAMRGWHLKHYNFECSCEVCTDGERQEKSSLRRFRLRELSALTEDLRKRVYPNQEEVKKLLEGYVEMAGLLVEEELRVADLGRVYKDIADLCERLGDKRSALSSAKLCADVYRDYYGDDHEAAMVAANEVRRLAAEAV